MSTGLPELHSCRRCFCSAMPPVTVTISIRRAALKGAQTCECEKVFVFVFVFVFMSMFVRMCMEGKVSMKK